MLRLRRVRLAVITGAADGIGLAAAKRLASLGMNVVLADNNAARLAEAAAAVPGDNLAVETDVADRGSVEALAQKVRERFGPVSLLLNNAGRGGGGDALSNPEGWEAVLATNLFGVLHGVQAFVPDMVKSDAPGLVINTGSKQGLRNRPAIRPIMSANRA